MEKTFQVKYSDGKTSRLYEAEVRFAPDALIISYEQEAERVEVRWAVERINTNRYGFSFEHKLTYGEFPSEIIEVDEAFFQAFQAAYPHKHIINRTIHYIKKRTWRTILLSLLAISAFVLLLYFLVMPAIAEHVVQTIPTAYEVHLGEKIYKQNMLSYDIDTPCTRLVNEYFQTLRVKSRYPVKITVVDYDEVNAYALPGGHIVVYSGLLEQMRNPEELVAVLGHEYGHIYFRHSLRAMAREAANYAVISLILGDVSGVTGVMVQNADNIRSLQYSRELESQADTFGLRLMQQKGVNPQGMIWLLENLSTSIKEKRKKKTIKITVPEFMSTHPYTKHRIAAMKMLLKNDRKEYKQNERLQVIWGLIKKQLSLEQ